MNELEDLLAYFGYSNGAGSLPVKLDSTEKSFVKWVTSELKACKDLTGESKTRFDDMRQRGSCYSESETAGIVNTVILKDEEMSLQLQEGTEDLLHQLEPLREHLRLLNHTHSIMRDEYSQCLKEQEHWTQCLTNSQSEYSKTNQEVKSVNNKMNQSLDQLRQVQDDIIKLYRQEVGGASYSETMPISLAECSFSGYYQSESAFLKELTVFVRNQFAPGVCKMVESLSYTEDAILNPIDGRGQSGRGHNDSEVYRQYRQELERLRKILPVCEFQLVNSEVMTAYMEGAVRRGREELHSMARLDTTRLSDSIQQAQSNITESQTQLHHHTDNRLVSLVREAVQLQFTCVVSDDHDEKLLRQAAFTDRQDKIIQHLTTQRARYQLVSLLLEVDRNRHSNCYRLLQASSNQLGELRSRNTATKLADTATPPQLLGIGGITDELQLLTTDTVSVNETDVVTTVSKQKECIENGLLLYNRIKGHTHSINSNRTVSLRLCPVVYEVLLGNVEKVVMAMEEKIKELIKDHAQKKKVLQHDPLLHVERNLFVHFFTDPAHLPRLLADLAAKIDSRVTTNQMIVQ